MNCLCCVVNIFEFSYRESKLESEEDSRMSKSKEGRMYKVGSRWIRMCEKVKEYEEMKVEESKLKGSVMYKMRKLECKKE